MNLLHEAMEKTGKREMGILKQVTTDLDYAQLSPSRSYERYITLLREYVSSRLDQPLTRDSLAKELGISSDHLSHVVFQAMGCSLKSFLTQERMRHGRELLRTTTLSIGEISAACGYESPAYFSQVYRDTYHHSPRDERRAM